MAEDAVLVQVRRAMCDGAPGAIFFLNTSARSVQRTYYPTDLGIKDAVYLYIWKSQTSGEQALAKMTLILAGHQSALYFFSSNLIRDIPVRLSS